MSKILIVEDEHKLRKMLEMILSDEGFDVRASSNGEEAWKALQAQAPDLVLTDVMMDEVDGIELTKRIRGDERLRGLPVVMLTAKGVPEDRYSGFESGASDYVVKPFDPVELVFRIRARLAENHAPASKAADKAPSLDFRFDERTGVVRSGTRSAQLTQSEVSLLAYLLAHPDRIVTYEELLTGVLGYAKGTGVPEVVRTHISNIRQKLEKEAGCRPMIVTIARQGYMLKLSA